MTAVEITTEEFLREHVIVIPVTVPPAREKTAVEKLAAGVDPSELGGVDRDEAIAIIRKALKERSGKTWSVTGSRGSAWGWITIQTPPARRVSSIWDPVTETSTEGPAGGEGAYYTSAAECAELAELLGLTHVHSQGVLIPASSEYRREHIARALGVEAKSIGVPYWD